MKPRPPKFGQRPYVWNPWDGLCTCAHRPAQHRRHEWSRRIYHCTVDGCECKVLAGKLGKSK